MKKILLSTILFLAFIFGANAQTFVQDIDPGIDDSEPDDFVEFNGNLYFTAVTNNFGREIWVYDGIVATLALDINPGQQSSYPQNLVVVGSNLFFVANDVLNGTELWKYDGSTATIIDINPGAGGSSPSALTVVGSELYFSAYDGVNGVEFWKYDGNTATLIDINPGTGSSNPGFFTTYGTDVFFRAQNDTSGVELFKYDGTNATLININPNGSSDPMEFFIFNSELYFSANNGVNGHELMKYNGDSVSLVQDLYPGPNSSTPNRFVVYNSDLYFQALGDGSGLEFWKYDGTNASLVLDINPGTAHSYAKNFTVFDSKLYFSANDGVNGTELWKHDGVNTVLEKDFHPTQNGNPVELTILGTDLYLVARDTNESQIWKHNGDTIVPLFIDIYTGVDPYSLTVFGSEIFYAAYDTTHGYELWKLEGTFLVNSITVQGQGGVSTITTNGGTLQMEAAVLPANATDASYTWSLSNGTGSATINISGLLTASTNGTVTVTATANDGSGVTGSSVITISNQIVLVNDISVQGENGVSTITTNGGTLQMEATVLPANATDATYTWSVSNGTGSATINTSGLLTASTNGTVTVTATANDGSGVSGDALITISNQGVGVKEQEILNKLSIYPNPTSNVLTIDFDKKIETIKVIDITGKTLQTISAPSNIINVDKLEMGIYFLQIHIEDVVVSKKFVKE